LIQKLKQEQLSKIIYDRWWKCNVVSCGIMEIEI